ncbi:MULTISPECIES: ATP-dependent metallopeptidase FtsH/Yme1/Tma family protein [unclassified Clostridium]|uniref:ATP-dependent metallopeptidase FtsH/Yme1/Tma family protein n=1 Tax=unclassified Clostridium TaxID=2614128 RepID=UPI00321774B6
MDNIKKNLIIIPLSILVLSIVALILLNIGAATIPYKTYSDFLLDLESNNISKVSMSQTPKITVIDKFGKKYSTDNPNSNTLKETLLKEGITVESSSTLPTNQRIAVIFLSLSAVTTIFMTIKRNSSGGTMTSITAIDGQSVSKDKFNFNSVAGNDEAKESLKDIVDFLKNPEKYASYGARMPKGVILYGDPGTGKTLLAKAIAGEAKVPFYAVSGSDFVQMYVGVGASRIRNLFKKAKTHGKAVIFIDEIDAIGKQRSSNKSGNSDEKDQTLNALLTEMSGFKESEGIVVIAATNRLDILDEALLRPGRFDRHIEVSLPDINAREKILNLHFKNKPVSDMNIRDIAHNTAYFSGAKLENLVNEAAIIACKEDAPYITGEHMDKAFSIVVAGHEKLDKEALKEEDMKITAYHEVGHALISHLKVPEEKISKITIIPTSKGAGGYTLTIGEDNTYHNLDYLKRKIMVLLGGRAAEEIIFGEEKITTGAFNDLKKTTNIVNNMVCEYGMGKSLGLLRLSEMQGIPTDYYTTVVLEECKSVLDELYEEVKNTLNNNLDLLVKLSEELLLKETLYTDDILNLIYGKTS